LSTLPRYHKWPNYEVFELLQDNQGKLNGFRVHFSNGNSARFLRTPGGCDCTNIIIEGNGMIGFMIGSLDERQRVWIVDGGPVGFGDRNALDEL
jgi:hypothetical protein